MPVQNQNERSIIIFQPDDEVRHPYEAALSSLVNKIDWINGYNSLLEIQPKTPPVVVVIDIDALRVPYEVPFQELRTQFPESDLIALSSSDSSQLALQCIRSGFCDFLLKPASPEELAFCIRKCIEKKEFLVKVKSADTRSSVLRAVTQISTSYTPAPVRFYSLDYLKDLTRAKAAVWAEIEPLGDAYSEVLCAIPKQQNFQSVWKKYPPKKVLQEDLGPVNKSDKDLGEVIIIPCKHSPNEVIFLWGIEAELTDSIYSDIRHILEHAESTLHNLQKIDELKHQTFVDDLTGLYNSRFLKFAVTNAVMKCKRPGQFFSVLFIDLDHFKQVNDKNGHLVGSDFLIAIGRTIKNAVRNIDPVFRYGGDEFVVILNGQDTEGASIIAERIRKSIERRVFKIRGIQVQATVSIGVATYPIHAQEKEELLALADEAMYNAKKSSRNTVSLAVGIESEKKLKKA